MTMTEEMSIGVKILLERAKSNPEEMTQEYGKWHQVRDAVYAYKEDGQRRAWLRGLREEEIDLLYEAFCTGARQIFDDYVLKTVLGADEGETQTPKIDAYMLAQGKRISNPHMLQNSVQPGSWQNVATQTSDTSILSRLRKELGIK
jgi:hypothetical protein